MARMNDIMVRQRALELDQDQRSLLTVGRAGDVPDQTNSPERSFHFG